MPGGFLHPARHRCGLTRAQVALLQRLQRVLYSESAACRCGRARPAGQWSPAPCTHAGGPGVHFDFSVAAAAGDRASIGHSHGRHTVNTVGPLRRVLGFALSARLPKWIPPRQSVGSAHIELHLVALDEILSDGTAFVSHCGRVHREQRVPRHGQAYKRHVHVNRVCVRQSDGGAPSGALRSAPNVTTLLMAPLRSDPPRMHTMLRMIVKPAHSVFAMSWCSIRPGRRHAPPLPRREWSHPIRSQTSASRESATEWPRPPCGPRVSSRHPARHVHFAPNIVHVAGGRARENLLRLVAVVVLKVQHAEPPEQHQPRGQEHQHLGAVSARTRGQAVDRIAPQGRARQYALDPALWAAVAVDISNPTR